MERGLLTAIAMAARPSPDDDEKTVPMNIRDALNEALEKARDTRPPPPYYEAWAATKTGNYAALLTDNETSTGERPVSIGSFASRSREGAVTCEEDLETAAYPKEPGDPPLEPGDPPFWLDDAPTDPGGFDGNGDLEVLRHTGRLGA